MLQIKMISRVTRFSKITSSLLGIKLCAPSLQPLLALFYFARNRNSLLLMRERGSKRERVWRLIMKEAIQIIQMLALPPSSPPPRQWRVFSVPREWCQHGPLKTAAVRSEMNALAEHNGPNLNTTRIYARSEPQQKKEGYSAPIQPCCYFIRVVNLLQPFIPFVVFKCLWSLKHVDDLTGVCPYFGPDFIIFVGS